MRLLKECVGIMVTSPFPKRDYPQGKLGRKWHDFHETYERVVIDCYIQIASTVVNGIDR